MTDVDDQWRSCTDVVRLKSGGPAMPVIGRVESRSSSAFFRDCDAPSESKIHRLNPRRRKRIREKMKRWRCLEPGSLNLGVDGETLDRLMEVKELIFEPHDEVEYPPGWQHIPKRRGGYKYYLATATVKGETQEVLVRRAINPLPGRIELFAAVNLRDRFRLRDGNEIKVAVFPAA